MKTTKRVFALFAGLCVLAACPVSVRADADDIKFTKSMIDTDRACSVTIRDYVSNSSETALIIDGNTIDVPGLLPDGAMPVGDVVFGFLKIADIKLTEHEGTVEISCADVARPFLELVSEVMPKEHEVKASYSIEELSSLAEQTADLSEPSVRRLVSRYGEIMPATDEDGVSSVFGLPTGLYLFAEIKSPDNTVPGSPFCIQLPQTNITEINIGLQTYEPGEIWLYDVTAYPKSRSLSIDKAIVAGEDISGASETGDRTTASLGDTVSFLVTSTVPKVSDHVRNRLYEIRDIMDRGLSFNSVESITLGPTKETAVPLTEKSDYKISMTRTDSGGQELLITFTKKGLARLDRVSEASHIYLRYSSVLNKDAEIAGDGNRNVSYLSYGTNHTGDLCVASPPVTVFTYQLSLQKIFKPSVGHFGKVRFSIASGGKKKSFVRESDGIYHKAAEDEDGMETDLVSPNDASGLLIVKGLKNGTYSLTEEETLSDYSLLREPVEVTIKNRNMKIDVENSKSIDLVHTGGAGLMGILAVSASLSAAGILIISYAKRKG